MERWADAGGGSGKQGYEEGPCACAQVYASNTDNPGKGGGCRNWEFAGTEYHADYYADSQSKEDLNHWFSGGYLRAGHGGKD